VPTIALMHPPEHIPRSRHPADRPAEPCYRCLRALAR
jgi:hypothetical protein